MGSEVVLHGFGRSHPAVIVLPKDWRVIAVDSTIAQIDRLVTSLDVDAPEARSFMRQSVVTALDQAKLIGGVLVAVLFGGADVPVAASVVACELAPEYGSAAAVELSWKAAGRATDRHSLPEGPLVVSTRLRPAPLASSNDTFELWEMQAALPHPKSGGLLFSFSTPMVGIADQLKVMALAALGTVRWNEEES